MGGSERWPSQSSWRESLVLDSSMTAKCDVATHKRSSFSSLLR